VAAGGASIETAAAAAAYRVLATPYPSLQSQFAKELRGNGRPSSERC